MATLNDLVAAEADRDNSNRLLDECRRERNMLQKICAERSDEIARLRAFVAKVAEVTDSIGREAAVVLRPAPSPTAEKP